MTKKSILWILFSLVIIALAAGCDCDDADISSYEILLDSPGQNEVVISLSPTFSWHDQESCIPDYLFLKLKENGTKYVIPINKISGGETTFTMTSSLQPGREYVWELTKLFTH